MSVTIVYDKGFLPTSQANYLHNVLDRYGMLECNTVETPRYGPELSKEQPGKNLLGARYIKLYQELVRSIPYLAHVTRYAMCYKANNIARAGIKPSAVNMTAANHLLLYIEDMPDLEYRLQEETAHY